MLKQSRDTGGAAPGSPGVIIPLTHTLLSTWVASPHVSFISYHDFLKCDVPLITVHGFSIQATENAHSGEIGEIYPWDFLNKNGNILLTSEEN